MIAVGPTLVIKRASRLSPYRVQVVTPDRTQVSAEGTTLAGAVEAAVAQATLLDRRVYTQASLWRDPPPPRHEVLPAAIEESARAMCSPEVLEVVDTRRRLESADA